MILLRTAFLIALLVKPALAPAHVGIDEAPARFHRLLSGLARHENCQPPLVPTCISFAGQPGARRTPGGYAAFRHPADRWRAAEADLRAKCDRGLTVRAIVSQYNQSYLEQLLAETGLRAEDQLR